MNSLSPKKRTPLKKKYKGGQKIENDADLVRKGLPENPRMTLTRSYRPRCGKCAGWIIEDAPSEQGTREIKCLNCGWKPQYHARIIVESEEIRSIRQYTQRLFFTR